MKTDDMKLNILYITNVPSPYRVDYFNELGKFCNLTVLFEKSTSDERDSSWEKYNFTNFKGIILKGKKITVDSAFCPCVVNYLRSNKYDRIIVTDFLLPTGMLAISYMRIKEMKYYLESDGGFPKNGAGIKEKIKKFFIRNANGYFSTGREHDKYYISYGADSQKIHRYCFTSLKNEDLLPMLPSDGEKKELKRKLNLQATFVVLAVGQFIPRKGFDILLKVAKLMQDRDIIFAFVGGDPTTEYLNTLKEDQLTNVRFIGYQSKDKLAEYYCASDVFVHPTREDIWGLVVNEAMAYGLPIVTTDRCNAGLELVHEGENGYIVAPNDVQGLHIAINKVLHNQKKMGEKSLEIIATYTIENMAKDHILYFTEED